LQALVYKRRHTIRLIVLPIIKQIIKQKTLVEVSLFAALVTARIKGGNK
jgi:hypothetical protein